MSEPPGQLAIGEVAERAGMKTSRIRYYEACHHLTSTPVEVQQFALWLPSALRRDNR
jgi:hypothetical protein